MRNKEIASALGITTDTIGAHVKNIYSKLGCTIGRLRLERRFAAGWCTCRRHQGVREWGVGGSGAFPIPNPYAESLRTTWSGVEAPGSARRPKGE